MVIPYEPDRKRSGGLTGDAAAPQAVGGSDRVDACDRRGGCFAFVPILDPHWVFPAAVTGPIGLTSANANGGPDTRAPTPVVGDKHPQEKSRPVSTETSVAVDAP